MDKMAEGGNGRDDDNTWDCTVCTFKNHTEAFKCLMCDVRKGTSTRKPRINPELVAQQVARQQQHLLQKISHGQTKDTGGNGSSGRESREGHRDSNSRDGSSNSKESDHQERPQSKEKNKESSKEGNGKESFNRADSEYGPETKKHLSSQKQTKHRRSQNNNDGTPVEKSNNSRKSNNNTTSTTNTANNKSNTKSSSSSSLCNNNNYSSEAVTVNNVTVIITEFQKDQKDRNSLSLPFSQLN